MSKIDVRYIGTKPEWRDHLYGSGLYFSPQQVRSVPYHVGRRLLRHADLFVIHVRDERQDAAADGAATTDGATTATTGDTFSAADAGSSQGVDSQTDQQDEDAGETKDDTDELLADADKEREEQEKAALELASLHREIDQMDFPTLSKFAEERYGLKLTKQKGLERGRAELHARIDQFGPV